MSITTDERVARPDTAGVDPVLATTVSPRARRWWRATGVLLALASLLWGAFSVINLLAHEESSETSTYAASDVMRLDIASDTGSVTVQAGTGDSVLIRTDISRGLGTTETTERLTSGVLELRGRCRGPNAVWCSVDYVVEIPADRFVTIDASNGTVVVRGLTGNVEIDNDNGRIEVDDVGGDLSVSNDNGSIVARGLSSSVVRADNDNGRIDLSFDEAPDSVTASTSNGGIAVEVPDTDVAFDVDIRASNGSTESGVRTDPASSNRIELS
ncbi:MAG: hypothetical protein ABJ314_17795, partial [Ilumatobacter sp.]